MIGAGQRVSVQVPATSANLGPGFDCMGVSLSMWDHVTVTTREQPGLLIQVAGEGHDTVPRDESHLVVATLRQGLVDLGHPHPDIGLELSARNHTPQSRGLGSSASAIVSGLCLAWGLARPGEPLDRDHLLTMATAIEGHPDNAAPAILGGAQVAWLQDGEVHHIGLDVHPAIRFRAYVPNRHVPTALARHVLPKMIPRSDAVHQVLASTLLVTALTSAPDRLLAATQDWIHQPYRRPLMPESGALIDRLRRAGVPAVISGAGPTVLALGTSEMLSGADEIEADGFLVLDLELAGGARLLAPEKRAGQEQPPFPQPREPLL
ncbi:homoserine kinase [Acidipropionibacterium jensenii]|uniref:Homoserine kinase n=2 Tax=Acidipropionibacterium jensenii TaxID=1749 RepID=A0A3S4UWX3_9ACTN|nr:homoserine kinase [Acidipropionibacterium jensenii]MDN5978071.1 homoserine kinase [Acidipropionibacterium jensenii]MDN5996888.1 homoserine kinase [Acidipropionibacterium jensenii]MDN6020806.1 homoserine kinase [Acidipropionibacterium jensenii]MDN6426560.1 homoserine kinase [Acidipropionibacterium jensenii]MDN6442083.1 homoserine kinase [Acidipropionibacterium jensenii]